MTSAVVTGGAGFIGSHLCDYLLAQGYRVICMDNLETASLKNIEHIRRDDFVFVNHDVMEPITVEEPVDVVYHLAAIPSPIDYLRLPLLTLKIGSYGTHNALGLAKWKRARFVLASTSEVYGDPQVHPQPETYWGNVNPVGPRGVYDEAKRYSEAMTMAYHRQQGVDTAIVRIFNSILADEQVLFDDGLELRREPISTWHRESQPAPSLPATWRGRRGAWRCSIRGSRPPSSIRSKTFPCRRSRRTVALPPPRLPRSSLTRPLNAVTRFGPATAVYPCHRRSLGLHRRDRTVSPRRAKRTS